MGTNNSSVDVRQFNQMCQSFARAVVKPLPAIVKPEVGKVLEKTLSYTRAASANKIRARYDQFVPMSIDSYSPSRARRYGNAIGKGKYLVYYMENKYPNELWSRLNARRTQLIQRRLAARGLAKKSWLQIAETLGIKIIYPGYVGSAVATTGKVYKDTTATQEYSDTKALIIISNSQPTVNAIGGQRALQSAIDGRTKYFYNNMRLGVFNSLKEVARAYPGVSVTALAA